jgi:hypothetical protein
MNIQKSFGSFISLSLLLLAEQAQASSPWLELGPEKAAPPAAVWQPEAAAVIRLTRLNPDTGEQGSVDVAAEAGPTLEGGAREVQYRPATPHEVGGAIRDGKLTTIVLTLEGGVLFVNRNESALPGNGPRLDLTQAEAGPIPAFRVYLWWMITKKHSLRLLYAPLEVKGTFTPAQDVLFDEVNFLAGQPIDALYRFNSYRLSYIYHFDPIGRFAFRLGFTAKIRDAETSLNNGIRSAGLTDLGFVPLINFGMRVTLTEKTYLDFDVDGSWAPQGRAIDAALKAGYQLHPNVALEAGFRTVEGGADVDKVYTFAWLNQVFLGVTARF